MPIPPGADVPLAFRNTPLAEVWYEAWLETGDRRLARVAAQEAPEYDQYFPGNRREDGTVRYTENVYKSVVEGFKTTVSSYGIDPALFQNQYGNLISGEVSNDEFLARVDSLYTRVIDAAPEITAWYANNLGLEMTTQGMLASLMDDVVAGSILDKQITMAEIGGEAARRGMSVAASLADMLFEAGVDEKSEAAQLFAAAEATIPVLSTLAQRHADPDDDFDLNEFVAVEVLGDPFQSRRMRRLQAQEKATFSQGVGLGGLMARDQAGGLTGLVER